MPSVDSINPLGTQTENTQPQNSSSTVSTETDDTGNFSNETGGGGNTGTSGPKGSEEVQKVNYTLSIDSFPEELEVLTNYSINNVNLVIRDNVPYNVSIESGTIACVLLTSPIKGGGVIKWELDGEECAPYICSGFIGCAVPADGPHTAVVFYTTPS